jgi:hypothetical protein
MTTAWQSGAFQADAFQIDAAGVNYADNLSVGTYAISGKDVTDSVVRGDSLSVGAYVLSGKDITDVVGTGVDYADNLSAGSYSITGYTLTDSKVVADTLSKGSYVYTGIDLNDVVAGSTDYADNLSTGSYLITGQSITDVAPGSGSYSNEVELLPKRYWYVKKRRQIVVFDSPEEADAYIEAERKAEEAIEQAQKTSRRARKRLRERVLKVADVVPAQTIQVDWLADLVERYQMPVDIPSLIQERDLAEVARIALIAQQMQDEEEVELLLMA